MILLIKIKILNNGIFVFKDKYNNINCLIDCYLNMKFMRIDVNIGNKKGL